MKLDTHIGEKPHDIAFGNDFLDRVLKAQAKIDKNRQKQKQTNGTTSNLKTFTMKGNNQKSKRQPSDRRKYLQITYLIRG